MSVAEVDDEPVKVRSITTAIGSLNAPGRVEALATPAHAMGSRAPSLAAAAAAAAVPRNGRRCQPGLRDPGRLGKRPNPPRGHGLRSSPVGACARAPSQSQHGVAALRDSAPLGRRSLIGRFLSRARTFPLLISVLLCCCCWFFFVVVVVLLSLREEQRAPRQTDTATLHDGRSAHGRDPELRRRRRPRFRWPSRRELVACEPYFARLVKRTPPLVAVTPVFFIVFNYHKPSVLQTIVDS